MRCLFLYNPQSGKGKIRRKLALVERKLREKYDEVTLYATKSAEDMTDRARAGAEEYDAIVFSGGDGTFNNVLQGIGEKDVQLGYLPTGTANDVARSLGIPKRIKGALGVILNGRSDRVDCMRINGERYAMYVAAAGAFTSVTYETPQNKKRKYGWAAYAAEGLRRGMGFQPFPVKIDCGGSGTETDCVLLLVMNGRSVAGFPVNRRASMQDGKLEIALVQRHRKKRGKISSLFAIAHLFLFSYRVRRKRISYLEGEGAEIHTDESVVWDFDGEKGVTGNVKIEVLSRRVRIFVPKDKQI